MNSAGHFRNWTWDPLLLIAQILAMLSIFYASIGLWLMILDTLTRSSLSLQPIFNYQGFSVQDVGGRRIFLAYLLNALTCSAGLWLVVRRAKLCLDFTITIYFWHLILTWIYNGAFPSSVLWWLFNISCITITTVLGEYMCMQTEMRAIPVSLGPRAEV